MSEKLVFRSLEPTIPKKYMHGRNDYTCRSVKHWRESGILGIYQENNLLTRSLLGFYCVPNTYLPNIFLQFRVVKARVNRNLMSVIR